MNGQDRIPTAELVGAFERESVGVLSAIAVTPPFAVSSRILNYGADGWTEVRSTEIDNWFDATVSFRNAQLEGSFWFGEREYVLSARVKRPIDPFPHGLWEWAAALGADWNELGGESWVHQHSRVVSCVRAFGEGLQRHYARIVSADEGVMRRLAESRAGREAEEREAWRRRDQERDEFDAAAAFREKDFHRVARLLSRHDGHLSEAQRLKLDIARRSARDRPT